MQKKANTEEQNLSIRFVRKWKITFTSANDCCFVDCCFDWFNFVAYLEFSKKTSMHKRKKIHSKTKRLWFVWKA